MTKERIDHEVEHGKILKEAWSGKLWYWETPAGQIRWKRRLKMLSSHILPHMNVLEVGCGVGYFTKEIIKTGAKITAIDISPDLMQVAQDNVKGPNLTFKIDNAYHLHFPDSVFDTIIGSSILHHLDNEQTIKFFYPFYFLSYLVIQYHFIRNLTSVRWSLLSLVLLVSSNFYIFHSTIAYRDAIMLYYFCSSIILILLWHRTRNGNILWVASLIAGMMTFNKLEGVGYLLIHSFILMILIYRDHLSLLKNKIFNFLRYALPSVTIFLFYQIYLTLAVIPSTDLYTNNNLNAHLQTMKFQFSIMHLQQMWTIFERMLQNLFLTNNWNIIWLILMISLINWQKVKNSIESKYLLLTLVLSTLMLLFGYSFTQHYHWAANTNTVISRGILVNLPLATMLIILINCSKLPTSVSKKSK